MTEPFDPKLSALYRRTPKDEPSESSDALITQLAHDAVKSPAKPFWGAQWAVAATLVLAVGVSWQVWQEQPDAVVLDAPIDEAADIQPSLVPAAPPVRSSARVKSAMPRANFAPANIEAKQAREQALEVFDAEQRKRLQRKLIIDAPCGQTALRFDSAPNDWREAVELLQSQGDKPQADCLIKAYEQRFGRWQAPKNH